MSSEREPRPSYERFQQLMDRIDTTSIEWWAESLAACRDALVESRNARLAFDLGGDNRDTEAVARMKRHEDELSRLAARFRELEERNRLPPLK